MQKQINSGIYILELKINHEFQFSHKIFGILKLRKGFYYYVGSAQKNLSQRIDRHIKKNKKLHWHIDFITTSKNVKVSRVFAISSANKSDECSLVKNLENQYNFTHPIKNFGNSDCNICESHLLYTPTKINHSHLFSLYQSTVLFIPSSKEIC
ncbi:MAG: GIY-YIG nuclease family protein [Ignavibacteriae bacterium]|nr:GIY-YIG nuclease family protein [Ignavibacteriota bacterium]